MTVTGSERAKIGASWRKFAAAGALMALFAMAIIGLHPLSPITDAQLTGGGDIQRQLVYGLILVFLVVTSRLYSDPKRALVIPTPLVLSLAWCWVSLIWAIAPGVGVRRLTLTTIVVWSIFKAVEQAGNTRTLQAIRIVLVVTLLLNYLAIAISPEAVHQIASSIDKNLIGNWRGMLQHKNYTGAVCAYTIILFIFAARDINKYVRIAVLLATSFYLMKTRSETSAGMLAISLAVAGAFRYYNPKIKWPIYIGLGMLVAVGIGAIYVNAESLYNTFLDPKAVTGRGTIWMALVGYLKDHWLLGAGYGSFWDIGDRSPIYYFSNSWARNMFQGHNGYLDLAATTGIFGLVLALSATVVLPLVQLFNSTEISRSRAALYMAMIIFSAGHNFTESSLLDRDAIVEVFLMLCLALLHFEAKRKRRKSASTAGAEVGADPYEKFYAQNPSLRPR